MSWFKHHKTLELSGNQVKFDYHSLSGTLRVSCEGNIVFKKFLWLPYKRYSVTFAKQTYQIKALLLPISNIGVFQDKQVICRELFPKLKRYTLITFTLSCIKRLAMVFAYALS